MLINDNKIDLILSQDKNIMTIHYKTSVNYEDTDVNIELKKKAAQLGDDTSREWCKENGYDY